MTGRQRVIQNGVVVTGTKERRFAYGYAGCASRIHKDSLSLALHSESPMPMKCQKAAVSL